MKARIKHLRRFFSAFLADTRGVMLPYVAIMMVVFIGLGALALDGGRFMSLQTQMQGVADSLALAGARELNLQAGARARATSAINVLVSNGLTGLGYSGSITHAAPVFYSALPAANAGFTGTPATSDSDAKFVAVTVNPATIPTVMPIGFFKAGAANNFSAGAQAIAGFKNRAVCGVSPVFICNPYESGSMTDAQATAALNAALNPDDPAFSPTTPRKLFRMLVVGNNTSPGHFGWLQSQGPGNVAGCNPNSTPCLNELIAYDGDSLSNSCFDGSGVKMATGNKPVASSFNGRFDLNYNGNGPSATFTPSINVRKGYIAGAGKKGGSDWCGAGPGDYLAAQSVAAANATVELSVSTQNTVAVSGSFTFMVQSATNILAGMTILQQGTTTPLATVSSIAGTTVTASSKITLAANTALTFTWQTTDLPLDRQWTGLNSGGTFLQGNGDWDCASYWKINHGTRVYNGPGTCTSSNPTVSRFDVYQYENSLASDVPTNVPINEWSGLPQGTNAPKAETGAPLCAINGSGFTPTYNASYDPRVINVAVINCAAQTALGNITGGNSGDAVPVAGFARYFLTQPFNSDNRNYLYGEMTGLVNSLESIKIFNQVQLYR